VDESCSYHEPETKFSPLDAMLHLNPRQPKVFGVKFSLREIESISLPLKYAILSFGKCLNNQISGFQGDDIF